MTGRIKSVKPLRPATEADCRIKHGRRIQVGDPIDGFCFIHGEDGRDRFAHRSEFDGIELDETLIGLLVSFTPAIHAKGPRCLDVRLLVEDPARLPSERRARLAISSSPETTP